MEHGLPIGAAPDIHVSLVMLPEECKSLSDKHFKVGEMKLKLLSKVVRFGLEKRLRHREEQFGPPPSQARTPPPASNPGVSAGA
jgi:hypothetical protein